MLDFVAALVSVVCAYFFGWSPGDLIWGFWLMSLTRGWFLTLGMYLLETYRMLRNLEGFLDFLSSMFMSATLLFYVGFIFVHFTFFHLGHAVFLQDFFPMIPKKEGEDFFLDPVLYTAVLTKMWPMAVGAVVTSVNMLRPDPDKPKKMINPFGIYVNVVRIHLLIFVIAGMTIAKQSEFAIYVAISVTFLPFGSLWSWLKEWRASGKGLSGKPPLELRSSRAARAKQKKDGAA